MIKCVKIVNHQYAYCSKIHKRCVKIGVFIGNDRWFSGLRSAPPASGMDESLTEGCCVRSPSMLDPLWP